MTAAIAIAVLLGVIAVAIFSNSSSSSSSSQTPNSANVTVTIPSVPAGNSTDSIHPLLPPLTGDLAAQDVSCAPRNGTCVFTIVNNSNTSLILETCEIQAVTSSSNGVTQITSFNGTIGGPAALAGIPANSSVVATCAISPSHLSYQEQGSIADGGFGVKQVDSWDGYPAGTQAGANFEGTWS